MLKFGSAANWFDLRGIIAEFYCCDSEKIIMNNGAIYKNGVKMSTEYAKKGSRWYFYKKID